MVVFAIIMLGVLTGPANRIQLNRQELLVQTEAFNTGSELAQELIEEILTRKFDEKFCGPGELTNDVNNFSTTLGLDAGEDSTNMSTFDDVDDFNGYHNTVPTPRLGTFKNTCKVYFVADTSPDAVSGAKTFFKRVDVKIWNKYISTADSTISMSKIISYRYR